MGCVPFLGAFPDGCFLAIRLSHNLGYLLEELRSKKYKDRNERSKLERTGTRSNMGHQETLLSGGLGALLSRRGSFSGRNWHTIP